MREILTGVIFWNIIIGGSAWKIKYNPFLITRKINKTDPEI